MAALSTRPNPLKWTGGYYNREPLWPKEPDITIIKSLALKYLASELPTTLDLDSLQVEFFAQGGFNKLYSISCSGHSTHYLLRVALPLVPYYRIESEAAVLSYLKENTSIPVARVVAWKSSAATDLGFEWILLEKIEGVALYDIWRKVPWESKLEIVAALAPLLGQLRDHKFDRIGSLYFKGREIQPDPEHRSKFVCPTHDLLIDSLQIAEESKDPISEEASEQGGYVVDFNKDDWDSDGDEEAPKMEKLFNDYQDVVPEIFTAAEGVFPYVLRHHDLSLANILVNPDTYEITGIIDWEKIQVVPEWKGSRFPKFLTDEMDFPWSFDEEPRIPTSAEYIQESEDHMSIVVEERDRWDDAILRQHYDEALSRTRGEEQFDGNTSNCAKTKREFKAMILDVTDDVNSARVWLERYSESKRVITESEQEIRDSLSSVELS
ncbi:MAG: hypothetical protein ASARMPRED_003459 [Alectoria sarmentosa]|nr:MAG: hypothetical protein ASARMPRED_003459 [Alectoria sarmentosa]